MTTFDANLNVAVFLQTLCGAFMFMAGELHMPDTWLGIADTLQVKCTAYAIES